jgi:hypothetical protein
MSKESLGTMKEPSVPVKESLVSMKGWSCHWKELQWVGEKRGLMRIRVRIRISQLSREDL